VAVTWREYQEEAAAFFRSLGAEAITNEKMSGVRTTHNVDVLVRSHHVGFDVKWIVECKHWRTPVSKLHVLALREIVADTGADRGILLCEIGFQSGAKEAANLTNVQVTSLAELGTTATKEIAAMRMRELFDRMEECNDRYWEIPKSQRIKHGLRPQVGTIGFSGAQVVNLCRDLLSRAFRGVFPFQSTILETTIWPSFPEELKSAEEVVEIVEAMIAELDERLQAYEVSQKCT